MKGKGREIGEGNREERRRGEEERLMVGWGREGRDLRVYL